MITPTLTVKVPERVYKDFNYGSQSITVLLETKAEL